MRDYTPRSARAIAITLASMTYPRGRLCPSYHPQQRHSPQDIADGPQDPSAFIQRLSDTPSIRRACQHSSQLVESDNAIRQDDTSPYTQAFYERLRYWNKVLDEYSHGFTNLDPITPLSLILGENAATANKLCECIEWQANTLPDASHYDWTVVNLFVQRGYSYPDCSLYKDCDQRSKSIHLLDSLDHGPSFRLLSHLVEVVAENADSAFDAYHDTVRRSGVQWNGYKDRSLPSLISIRLADTSFHSSRPPVLIWLKKIFLRHWDGKVMLTKGSIAAAAIRILDTTAFLLLGYDMEDEERNGLWTYFPAISARIDAADIARSYMEVSEQDYEFHLLTLPSIFTPKELAIYFRTVNHLKMRQAHSEAEKATAIRLRHEHLDLDDESEDRLKWMEEHYLLLNIRRQNVVQDAFDQVWQRRRTELLRPLRVRLGEMDELEIGHDLGGVQIEFFNLLWRELLREEANLFTTDSSTGLAYFRPGSLQPLYMFELCGLLFGLAIYNGITLPVTFPMALYQRLTPRAGVDPVISDRWPEVSRSLESILSEDIPGLEAVFPFEANGVRLSVHAHNVPYKFHELPYNYYDSDSRVPLYVAEASRIIHHEPYENARNQAQEETDPAAGSPIEIDIKGIEEAWPGWRLLKGDWAPPDLDVKLKHRYVQDYKGWLAWGSVAPQLAAFQNGFRTIVDLRSTSILTKGNLRRIVEGTKSFEINDLMSVTQYEGYDPNSRYIRTFWRLVTSWPEEKQRQLLKFVTAIERMPAGGASNFTFKIERPRPDEPDKLPTSSTCFRTLYLPKYPSADVLDKKLTLAFEYGLEGFGTG